MRCNSTPKHNLPCSFWNEGVVNVRQTLAGAGDDLAAASNFAMGAPPALFGRSGAC
jgi:hypothetical protein